MAAPKTMGLGSESSAVRVKLEIDNVIEACYLCEQGLERTELEPIHACEGCKHRLYKGHGIEEVVLPFHIDSLSDCFFHVPNACILIRRLKKSGYTDEGMATQEVIDWLEPGVSYEYIVKKLQEYKIPPVRNGNASKPNLLVARRTTFDPRLS